MSVIDYDRMRNLVAEKIRRQNIALRQYRPRPEQLPFHLSKASERILRGGKRSGKTTSAAAEVASAALGIPLIGPDGKELPFRYPRNRPLLIWVIGYNEKHIGVIYKKLFTPGFKIIKDRRTGLWRTWMPWLPEDAEREDETKPSAPLIPGGPDCHPSGLIEEWGWENRSTRVFNVCRLKNGTEIHAFTSGGEAGQGEAVDLIWIDEDIKYQNHILEWQARLSDNRGRLIWSAWPHGNEALRRMSARAAEQVHRKNPDVVEWTLSFSGNPYIPEDEKRKRLEGWESVSHEVRLAQDLGIFTEDYQLVFPAFNADVHGIPRAGGADAVENAIALNGGKIPDNWARYLGVDPGHAYAAAIFVAVPPPSIGKYFVVYDEVYTERCQPDIQAELIAAKSQGVYFRAFIIDAHAGRQTTLAYGKRIVELYREAFEKHGLHSQLTGSGFLGGSDDVGARNSILRDWMTKRPDGTTMFRMVKDTTPHLRREFGLYRKKIIYDEVKDEVVLRNNHCCDACAYLAPMFDYGDAYTPPGAADVPGRSYADWLVKLTGEKKSDAVYMGAGTVPSYQTLTL